MDDGQGQQPSSHGQLGLWDAVSIIIGIVIGVSIFKVTPLVNRQLASPEAVLGVWALGGFLCLVGALCYAELATTYPRMGGDYVYLTRSFGPEAGFLFGWAQLTVVFPASIGMMAFVFGEYAVKLLDIAPDQALFWQVGLGFVAVSVLLVINVLGVVLGKTTQNILTATKVLGLGAIVLAGLFWGQSSSAWTPQPSPEKTPDIGLSLLMILYAFGGWNDAAFVAADMRNRRQIPTTLLVGTGGVMLIYLIINIAYIQGLGFAETQQFGAPIAHRTLQLSWGEQAAKVMSILVMISALGAMNGLLFAGSRVCSALGKEHSIFAVLGRWHPRLHSPVLALLVLAGMSLFLILMVGTVTGRDSLDQVLALVNTGPIPWGKFFNDGFDMLFAASAPVFWTFFLLTGLSLLVLRQRDADIQRPFQVPLYPILPLIFCGMCGFGLYRAVSWAGEVAYLGLAPLVIALPLYAISRYTPTHESQPLHRLDDTVASNDDLNRVMPPSRAIQPAGSPVIQEKSS